MTDCVLVASGEVREYTVRSKSEPTRWWTVLWASPRVRHCFCQGFQRSQDCRHAQAVHEVWAKEHGVTLIARRRAG